MGTPKIRGEVRQYGKDRTSGSPILRLDRLVDPSTA